MSEAVHQEVAATDRGTNRRLAIGVFAAPAAWLVHEVAGVALIGRHCSAGSSIPGWMWLVLIILPLAAAAAALAGVVAASGVLRRVNPGVPFTRVEGWSRVEFVAAFGVIFSSFLLLNIIYFGVLPFVVDICARII